MAELTIMLRRDANTGKQNVIVKLDSDPDALPIEHEQLHRRLVEKLVGSGLDIEDLGEIIVEREATANPSESEMQPGETQREASAQGE